MVWSVSIQASTETLGLPSQLPFRQASTAMASDSLSSSCSRGLPLFLRINLSPLMSSGRRGKPTHGSSLHRITGFRPWLHPDLLIDSEYLVAWSRTGSTHPALPRRTNPPAHPLPIPINQRTEKTRHNPRVRTNIVKNSTEYTLTKALSRQE